MFYVKQHCDPSKELVLKIYKNEDMKSYLKEIAVFKNIEEYKKRQNEEGQEKIVGFPIMTSNREGQKTAELLMEALGPNLRKLLKECPGNVFSKTTVYMITIQLVSTSPQHIFTIHG